MPLLLLIALIQSPDSGRELTEAIFRKVNQTTVICSSRKGVFAKASASSLPSDLTELGRILKGSTGLVRIGESEACFAWPSYPGKMVKSNYLSDLLKEEEPSLLNQGKLAFQGGRVTTEEGSSRIFLRNLNATGFSKPVVVHWFIQPLSLTVSCKNEREQVLLRLIADAAGATFSESAQEYRIWFSAESFRTRAASSFRDPEIMESRAITKEDSEFFVEALAQFTDEQIYKVYERDGAFIQVPLKPGAKAHDLVLARIAKNFASPGQELSPSQQQAYQWILDNVDFQSLGRLELRPRLAPMAGLPLRGRPNSYFGY